MMIPDPSSRHTPEYRKKLERRELRQLFGRDAPDVEWVDQLITRLNATPPDLDYTDKDYDDMEKARRILHQLRIKAGYDPGQPRDDWGRWVDEGGGGSGGSSPSGGNDTVGGYRVYNPSLDKFPGRDVVDKPLEVDKAAQYLHDHVDHLENKPGGNCARNVANAIRSTGIPIDPPPARRSEGATAPWAKDYGMPLQAAGFQSVTTNNSGTYPPIGYIPKKGDVVVIQAISDPKHQAGHMAMYDGKQWVSDFIQPNFWPGPQYRTERPNYTIYRHDSQ